MLAHVDRQSEVQLTANSKRVCFMAKESYPIDPSFYTASPLSYTIYSDNLVGTILFLAIRPLVESQQEPVS